MLVVHHSPTLPTRGIADAVLAGARLDEIDGVEVIERAALAVGIQAVLEVVVQLVAQGHAFFLGAAKVRTLPKKLRQHNVVYKHCANEH